MARPVGDKVKQFPTEDLFFNRELSWLEFNSRVLDEADKDAHPLLERLKFVTIFSSNLDEFFMVRVAGLHDQIESGIFEAPPDGLTPRQQLSEIRKRLVPMLQRQRDQLMNEILPELATHDIHVHDLRLIDDRESESIRQYFYENVLPILTPLALDASHPFPRLINRSLNIAFMIRGGRERTERKMAVLQVPPNLPRFVNLKRSAGQHFVLLEQVIQSYADILFPGYEIEATYCFRVTRDAYLDLEEEQDNDLISEVEEQVRQRRWGTAPVRLEVDARMPDNLRSVLMNSLELDPNDVYSVDRPLNLPDFMELWKLDYPELKDPKLSSRKAPDFTGSPNEIFEHIRRHDIMVHHPFDSFTNSVVKFLEAAAIDPGVLAIKMTLYRTGKASPVVEALKRAAERGKQVTAFVELQARFDEEHNIIWARELENSGVHVVYGVEGLKTHCKIIMVVRKERLKPRTYLHLSSGNYNLMTSRIYTDTGLFTAREEFSTDAIHLFNLLTGYSLHKEWEHLGVAPVNLKLRTLQLIEKVADSSTPTKPGYIFAKMNSLVDDEVIKALYRASQRGVKIHLLIRGICCLRPGVPGLSETIEVRSILGRFLEHSRIFYYKPNGGQAEMFMSSADWMPRNFHRRVELLTPILDPKIFNQFEQLIEIYWRDNTKAHRLNPDGSYSRIQVGQGEEPFSAQNFLLVQNRTNARRIQARKRAVDSNQRMQST